MLFWFNDWWWVGVGEFDFDHSAAR